MPPRAVARGVRQAAGPARRQLRHHRREPHEDRDGTPTLSQGGLHVDTVGQRDASPWISQIKVIAPRIALEITDEAVQMHGAMGITQDTPLAHMWTHLRTLRLADGPDAVHRRQVARAELRRYTNQKI